jgi:hypothetical protein
MAVIVWLQVNMRLGWSATIHALGRQPTRAKCIAVTITRPPNSAVM